MNTGNKALYIQSVDIQGFKTFADRTRILLTDGITAVVGPNGSGKSNVFDAIKWCVGEQSPKQLRGGRMSDVLFHGTDNRAAAAYSSVVINLANPEKKAPPPYSEFPEIAIERRLYQNGDTEYKINGARVRLRDIQDFWLDNAIGDYTFMEQGRVADLVQAKPAQVRGYIEEAAQIVKFRKRVEESQRKFVSATSHLEVLEAALQEEEKSLAYLGRQARKAKRYKELADEQKEVDLAWMRSSYEDLAKEIALQHQKNEQLDGRRKDFERAIVAAESGLSADHARITGLKEKVRQMNEKKADLSKAFEREVSLASHSKIERERLEARNHQLKEMLGRQQKDENELIAKLESSRQQLEERDLETDSLQTQLKSSEELLAVEQTALDTLIDQERKCQAELFQVINQIGDRKRVVVERDTRRIEQQERAESLREQAREANEKVLLCQKKVDLSRRAYNEKSAEVSALQDQREAARLQLDTCKGQLVEWEQNLRQRSVRRQELQTESTQLSAMLREDETREDPLVLKAESEGLLAGKLADLITVPAGQEEQTEKATGALTRAWVVKPEQRDSFMSLLATTTTNSLFVIPDSSSEGLSVLNRYYVPVMADSQTEVDPRKSGTVHLNQSGNFVRRYDAISLGGALKAGGDLVLRKRAASVETNLATEIVENERTTKELDQARKNLEKARGTLIQIDDQVKDQAEEAEKRQDSMIRAEQEEAIILARLKDLQEQLSGFETELAQDAGSAEETELLQLMQKEQEDLEQQLDRLHRDREAKSHTVRSRRENNQQLRDLYMQASEHRSLVRQELGQADNRLRENRINKQRHEEEIDRNNARCEELTKQQQLAEETKDMRERELDKLVTDLRGYEQQADQAEGGVSEQEERLRKSLQSRSEIETEIARLEEKMIHQQEKADELMLLSQEQYECLLTEVTLSEEPLTSLVQRKQEIETRIRNLGGIDLEAIQEFTSRQEDYDSKAAQRKDLLDSIQKLSKAIEELEEEADRRFAETFSEIEKHFRDVFPKLFPGGRAELRLEEVEGDALPGIQIMAYPPGKRFARIELLSGGEKSLTATAFILSIFLCNPSPFCLLDELDAPLDESNVELLGHVLKEMNEQSQVILITHKQQTMQKADRIYGVTLQEPGISSLYSIEPGAY